MAPEGFGLAEGALAPEGFVEGGALPFLTLSLTATEGVAGLGAEGFAAAGLG